MQDKPFTEKESLLLIQQMINKAKNSYLDSGLGQILWGAVITICGLVTFFKIKYKFDLPIDIWYLVFVAIIPQVYIGFKEGRQRKVKGYNTNLIDAVWIVFGFAVFLFMFINANIINKLNPVFQTYIDVKGTRPIYNYSGFSTSIFLLLYGIPTIITGTCKNMRSMLFGGIVCWICSIVALYTTTDVDMLLTAISSAAAWLIPGLIIRYNFLKEKRVNV